MEGLGIVLLALGLADLVAGGLAGSPASFPRAITGIGVAFSAALLVSLALGLSGLTAAQITALSALAASAWILPRVTHRLSQARAQTALGALAGFMILGVFLSGVWAAGPASSFGSMLENLPYARLAHLGQQKFVLLTGVLVVLTATGNGFVRAVLAIAGTTAQASEQKLRGGRIIGPIERILIFGMAVAGYPTAAALIVSAKSILRFPELSRVASDDRAGFADNGIDAHPESPRGDHPGIDSLTEYFLLGSLASWLIALAPAVLFVD
jgi:hypothetical protein